MTDIRLYVSETAKMKRRDTVFAWDTWGKALSSFTLLQQYICLLGQE